MLFDAGVRGTAKAKIHRQITTSFEIHYVQRPQLSGPAVGGGVLPGARRPESSEQNDGSVLPCIEEEDVDLMVSP
jgi:hypothetical protein